MWLSPNIESLIVLGKQFVHGCMEYLTRCRTCDLCMIFEENVWGKMEIRVHHVRMQGRNKPMRGSINKGFKIYKGTSLVEL
jgi:hypothetical protein